MPEGPRQAVQRSDDEDITIAERFPAKCGWQRVSESQVTLSVQTRSQPTSRSTTRNSSGYWPALETRAQLVAMAEATI